MAELPELTVYVELLGPRLAGHRLAEVAVHQPRALRGLAADAFVAAVTGCRVLAVARRGKTLTLPLEGGSRLDVHLMLGGEPYWFDPGDAARPPQPVITLARADGARLVFSDHNS